MSLVQTGEILRLTLNFDLVVLFRCRGVEKRFHGGGAHRELEWPLAQVALGRGNKGLKSTPPPIAIVGDRWWPQTAKQDGDRISKQFLCSIWKKRNGRLSIGGVSIKSRDGAPSRKGCVVNIQMTQGKQKMSTPP